MEVLGEDKPTQPHIQTGMTTNSGLTPFGGAVKEPIINPIPTSHSFPDKQPVNNLLPTNAPKGFYVISFKANKDEKRELYTVTNHLSIDKFIQDMLQFGVLTYDVKIIEKTDDYLDAVDRMNILVCQSNGMDVRLMKFKAFMNKEIISWKDLFGFSFKK